jgi:hypothetical protein
VATGTGPVTTWPCRDTVAGRIVLMRDAKSRPAKDGERLRLVGLLP